MDEELDNEVVVVLRGEEKWSGEALVLHVHRRSVRHQVAADLEVAVTGGEMEWRFAVVHLGVQHRLVTCEREFVG